ncbi:MAG TPA: TIR domain-containing protein [Thermoanaerobaculia bacterium]|nr:TIR domain-containing protein [Thermoanaerobaculia bacterium]
MAEPEYDVFVSHASADLAAAEKLARLLQAQGLKPWLDEWDLVAGEPWQEAIEAALARCAACAVLFGPGATGYWQNEEMRASIENQVEGKALRVIAVLLPDTERPDRSRLPALLRRRTWIEFHGTIEEPRALRRLIAGIRGKAPGPDPEAGEVVPAKALDAGTCPYRGLQRFDVEDAAYFRGREVLTGWLLAKLHPTRSDQRFLAISGPSGSGKSSLARAGLLASLKSGALPGSGDWPLAVCMPGPNPLESLALALVDALQLGSRVSTGIGLMQDLGKDHRTLHLNSRFALHGAADRRLVVLIDQFEEVFTLCTDEAQRQALIRNLLYAALAADGQTAVVLTLRSDFYGRCAEYPELASAVSDRGELVGQMAPDELRKAIEEPARTAGLELEGDLADRLMEDVEKQPGYLPLLEHALRQLWQERDGNRLTAAAYRRIGGVAGALQQHAEEVFTGFDEGQREACRRVLLRLVQVEETRAATRRRLAFDELVSATDPEADRRSAAAVVDRLTAERLLTAETAATAGAEKRPTVELAHEALIGRWTRLRGWIDADREALGVRRRVDEAAREWSAGGGDPSYLYTGARLAQAEEWAADRAGELNASSRAFLAASAVRRDAEIEARRRRRRWAIVFLASTALLAALVAAAMFGLWQRSVRLRQESERQRRINLSTQLADGAQLALASNPLTALLLAASAARLQNDLPVVRGALLGALALSDAQPMGRPGIVSIAASSDRRSMATAGQDGTVTLWRLEPGTPPVAVRTFRVQGSVADLALSNDRRWLLVRDRGGNVRRLDLTREDQGTPLPDEDWRDGDPFSADSHWLTLDLADTPVRYDLLHGAVREMPGATPAPPDGADGNARAKAMAPPGARKPALSSGGQWLAWGEESGAVRLKDEAFPELPLIELPGQGQPVGFLTFVPGDRWLVTQGGAEAPRLWDLRRFPQGGILAATPDGSRLVVGRPGANVHVEGTGDTRPLQGVEAATGIWAFSPDGSWLAGGSPGGKLLVWKLGAGDPAPRTFPGVGVIDRPGLQPPGRPPRDRRRRIRPTLGSREREPAALESRPREWAGDVPRLRSLSQPPGGGLEPRDIPGFPAGRSGVADGRGTRSRGARHRPGLQPGRQVARHDGEQRQGLSLAEPCLQAGAREPGPEGPRPGLQLGRTLAGRRRRGEPAAGLGPRQLLGRARRLAGSRRAHPSARVRRGRPAADHDRPERAHLASRDRRPGQPRVQEGRPRSLPGRVEEPRAEGRELPGRDALRAAMTISPRSPVAGMSCRLTSSSAPTRGRPERRGSAQGRSSPHPVAISRARQTAVIFFDPTVPMN